MPFFRVFDIVWQTNGPEEISPLESESVQMIEANLSYQYGETPIRYKQEEIPAPSDKDQFILRILVNLRSEGCQAQVTEELEEWTTIEVKDPHGKLYEIEIRASK